MSFHYSYTHTNISSLKEGILVADLPKVINYDINYIFLQDMDLVQDVVKLQKLDVSCSLTSVQTVLLRCYTPPINLGSCVEHLKLETKFAG